MRTNFLKSPVTATVVEKTSLERETWSPIKAQTVWGTMSHTNVVRAQSARRTGRRGQ